MWVCICNQISSKTFNDVLSKCEVRTLKDFFMACKCKPCCGSCSSYINELIGSKTDTDDPS